jgi:sec-independent protein translocase protein TatA
MGTFSIWHWLIVLLVILLLFGGGSKLSGLMGDLAKGIKSFKKNMSDEEKDASMAADAPPAPGTTHPAGSIPGPAPTAHSTGGTTTSAANTSRPAA